MNAPAVSGGRPPPAQGEGRGMNALLPAGVLRRLPLVSERRILPAPATELAAVCAWCPPEVRRPLEAAAHARGAAVSHGICPRCAARMRRQAEME